MIPLTTWYQVLIRPDYRAHLDQTDMQAHGIARNGLDHGGCPINVPLRHLQEKRLHQNKMAVGENRVIPQVKYTTFFGVYLRGCCVFHAVDVLLTRYSNETPSAGRALA